MSSVERSVERFLIKDIIADQPDMILTQVASYIDSGASDSKILETITNFGSLTHPTA